MDNSVQLNSPQCCSTRCGLERSLVYSVLECSFTSVFQENKSIFLLIRTAVVNGRSLGRWALPACRQMWGRAAWTLSPSSSELQIRDPAQGCCWACLLLRAPGQGGEGKGADQSLQNTLQSCLQRVIKPLNHPQFSYCVRESIAIGAMWGWLWPSKPAGENMSVRYQEQIFLCLKMYQSRTRGTCRL